MNKEIVPPMDTISTTQATVFCGIDVSAATLSVAIQQQDQPVHQRAFANSAKGHMALIAWLGKQKGFAQSMQRSKTDKADARMLAEYSQRMKFVPWLPPSRIGLQLRGICRHIVAVGVEHTREQNRLATAQGSVTTPSCVIADLKRSQGGLAKRLVKLRREAAKLISRDDRLAEQFRLMQGIPGIAQVSALQILGELVLLSPDATARRWVAHSGLDPVEENSGTSVHKPQRISRQGSRYLRRALYMPALTAVQRDPHLKAFYEALQARHKTKLQALMAVARKLLHAIHGIFHSKTPYDGHKLFPAIKIA